jgi:predicted CXXCH cytochrome family protein
MSRPILRSLALLAALMSPGLRAQDTPHDAAYAVQCTSCHNIHGGPGTSLTSGPGNANLCRSCHMAGGLATAKPLDPTAQAQLTTGNSHRWDAGPAGRVTFRGGAATVSTGQLVPVGAYTGVVPRTYTLTLTSSGPAGVATFAWSTPGGGSGTALLTGTAVPLDAGIALTFTGTAATAFQAGDAWTLQVRPGLRSPTDPVMAGKLENGQIMCSTCHDPHSQELLPFDPAALTGGARHFMRVTNDTGQMCTDCHASKAVTATGAGSHPVDRPVAGVGLKTPSALPLDAPTNQMRCQTCHQVHNGPTTDGSLLRSAAVTQLCTDCHTNADTSATARHLSPALGVIWPGGQYGSTFPAKADPAQRGSCANCHQPHGWTDPATGAPYPALLVERGGALCLTCHDANGPATTDLQTELAKASAHPVGQGTHSASEPVIAPDRHVDCGDCHNPHVAQARASLPGPASQPRPAAGPLTGVRGVSLAGGEVSPAAFEYQICLRCHGDSPTQPSPGRSRQFPTGNLRAQFDGSAASFHPVAVTGKGSSVPSLLTGWNTGSFLACTSCHGNDSGPTHGGFGPSGPHGSAQPHLLERATGDGSSAPYSEAKYALCFKCHSAAVVMSPQSFKEHDKHVRGGNYGCGTCHDPHGSPGYGRLLNFDTSIVKPLNGKLAWERTGPNQGTCTLTCHGEPHDGYTY